MTFKTDDRVYETSVTTGTGTYALDGAVTGFQAFSAMSANNYCPYFATDGTNWEAGIGQVLTGPARLARTTVLSSSNADAAVNWGGSTIDIRCGFPAWMAVPRVKSVSIAGGAGDTTLTQDEQRCDILILTGALTGNRNAIVDATPWKWIVLNSTTGAFTATVKVSGQTGVAVTQGRSRALYCDGTDVEDGYTDITAAHVGGLKQISGYTYANNGSDATNDIDFAAGSARDSTNTVDIAASALTKRLDANWAAGTNQGMRNSAAAIANTDYYLWAVAKAAGADPDYYAHTSATAATVLAALQAETGGSSYAYLRLIGWIKRSGGTIVAFHTYERSGGGLEVNWDVPTLDINLAATLTTSRRTDAVKVPLDLSTTAHLNVVATDSSATHINICCPDQTDAAPSQTAAPLANLFTASGFALGQQMKVRTSAAGLIASRATTATVDQYNVSTIGFEWDRRN